MHISLGPGFFSERYFRETGLYRCLRYDVKFDEAVSRIG